MYTANLHLIESSTSSFRNRKDIERKELSSKIQKHLQTLPSAPTLLVKPDQISYPNS